MSKIKLGNKVKDTASGFTGIATARIVYLNGCIQFCVKPKVGKDNKMIEGEYIDESQLEYVNKGVCVESKDTGGHQSDCPKH